MADSTNGKPTGWALEVVRGQATGRVFALSIGEWVLGNAPGSGAVINLAHQEGEASTRKMAAQHACLDCSAKELTLRDLESPGGTFLNRQRVLPGPARPLSTGDLIQLGGVQLKVVETGSSPVGRASEAQSPPLPPAPRPSPSSPKSVPFSYEIPGGSVCRNWDDVLTASSQRWEALREELVSGRLAAFLVTIGRGDLMPSPRTPGTPDDRLDAWLGSLPTTREARPELDVHPSRLVVRAKPGGGVIRKSVQVSNVGHRLLRSTARIEPTSAASWLAVAAEFQGQPFVTIDTVDLALEIAIPSTLPEPLSAVLHIEGNGGSKRVQVSLTAKSAATEFAGSGLEPVPATGSGGTTIGDLIARQSAMARLATWGLVALASRLIVGVASGSIGEDAMVASSSGSPKLGGVAILLASVGAILGGWLASRRGGRREAPTGAFAGGFSGLILSAALVATCRSVEPFLGAWSTSVVAVCGLWAVVGSTCAGVSLLIWKGKKP